MCRVSEVATRAWQTADKMKEKTGRSNEKMNSLIGYLSKLMLFVEWDKNTDHVIEATNFWHKRKNDSKGGFYWVFFDGS
jgi:hypothetical protein